MRQMILAIDPGMTFAWRYGMPFFYYRQKMFCYLWIHKKYRQPYLGIVEGTSSHHPSLIREKRSRMKIMLIDPKKDLPVRTIRRVLRESMSFYDKKYKKSKSKTKTG